MIKQTIFFTKPASLSLKYNQLIIDQRDGSDLISRPIEDIGIIIIENQQVTFTMPLLNALTDCNVVVVLCNAKSMPSSLLLPIEANSTLQETFKIQIAATEPNKKRIWKQIVEQKIKNQASLLKQKGADGLLLKPFYSNVLSGDSDNREGAAARVYWKELMGKQFSRKRDGDSINAMLNYGYAIVRSATARALMNSGLHPYFGIYHKNRYNAFPLADDVMEPYRPFVDMIVYDLCTQSENLILTKEAKTRLISVLHEDVVIDGKTHPLMLALTHTTASLARALADNKQKLNLPEMP